MSEVAVCLCVFISFLALVNALQLAHYRSITANSQN